MKIPNPFTLLLRAVCWPIVSLANYAVKSVRFQAWSLKKMERFGAPKESINRLAEAYNELNRKNGKDVIFRAAPIDTTGGVEQSQPDPAEHQNEAKP